MASSTGGRRTAAAKNGAALLKAQALEDHDALSLGDWKGIVRLPSVAAVPAAPLRRPGPSAWLLGAERHALSRGVTGIGSSPDNAIVLKSDGVSPSHAQVEALGDPVSWFVQDVGSVAGTFVNGDRVHVARRLLPGDTVRIGPVSLRFEVGGEALNMNCA